MQYWPRGNAHIDCYCICNFPVGGDIEALCACGGLLVIHVYVMLQTPITVILKLTVPVVDYEAVQNNWNKDLHALQCVTGPIVAIFLANYSGLSQLSLLSLRAHSQ